MKRPNDLCSCGSGKKFKRCCRSKQFSPPIEVRVQRRNVFGRPQLFVILKPNVR